MNTMNQQKGFTPYHLLSRVSKSDKGFTLLEALIYIALFTLIIGGAMVTVFQIIQGTAANYNHIILQEEANFLLRKINWALSGETTIITPTTSSPSGLLLVTKIVEGAPTNLTFQDNANDYACSPNTLCLKRTEAFPLNSSNVLVTNITFVRTLGNNGKPDSLTTSLTITTADNGREATESFSTTKYLRK